MKKKQMYCMVCIVLCTMVPALALEWDVDPNTSGLQGGAGTWDNDGSNLTWNNGSASVAWPPGGDAIVRGAAPATPMTLGDNVTCSRLWIENGVIVNPDAGGLYSIATSDVTGNTGSPTTAVINAPIEDITGSGVLTIQTNKNHDLIINGDIKVLNDQGNDLTFRRRSSGSGYGYIQLNGDCKGGTAVGQYWFATGRTSGNAPVIVDVNGFIEGWFQIQDSAIVEVNGRMEFDYGLLTYLNDVGGDRPVLQGGVDKTGVLAVKLANYYGSRYIRNTNGNGGPIYADNLNLEVDCAGWDPNDPATDVYVLVDNAQQAGGEYVHGYFNSVTTVNAPAGTVLTLQGEDTHMADVYMIVESADLDNSGCVDFSDLADFCLQWLGTCTNDGTATENCSGADLDHSGTVNFVDFDLFASKWQDGCP